MSVIENGVDLDPTSPLSSGGIAVDLGTEASGTTTAIDDAVTAAEAAQTAAETAQTAAEAAQTAAETAETNAETAETNAEAAAAAIEHFTAQIDALATTEVVAHAGLGGKPVFGSLMGAADATLLYLEGFSWSGDNLTIRGGPAAATGNVAVHYWIDKR